MKIYLPIFRRLLCLKCWLIPALCLAFFSPEAQTWTSIGLPGFSAGQAIGYKWVAIGRNDTPYVVYQDYFNGQRATVMKFDGTNWAPVGSPGFTTGQVGQTSIAIDSSNTLYIAYSDLSVAGNGATVVMKYSGGNWVTVGAPGFSDAWVGYLALALDPAGTPYVFYQDATLWTSNATVMKFNGTAWVTVGRSAFTAGAAYWTDIAIDQNGTPYVAYRDEGTLGKATVMKYQDTGWVNVGVAGFTPNEAMYTSIAIDKTGAPYVAFQDQQSYPYKASVMKYTDTGWIFVGNSGFSTGEAVYTSIAIDQKGAPHVAYVDYGDSTKATVMKYNGSYWVNEGAPGFSAGTVNYTSIAIDGCGNPYVIYSDGSDSNKTTVMKYNPPIAGITGNDTLCAGATTLLKDSSVAGTWSTGDTTVAAVDSLNGLVLGITGGTAVITYNVHSFCLSGITTATVVVDSIIDPGTITGNPAVCAGDSTLLTDTVKGGTWRASSYNAFVTQYGEVTGIYTGTNTINYTTTLGNCTASASFVITIHPLPYLGVLVGRSTLCLGQTTVLTDTFVKVGNGYWSNPDTLVTTDSAQVVTGISTGTAIISYSSIPDSNGCISMITFPISIITSPLYLSSFISNTCYGNQDGSIIATANGSNGPFTWKWSNGDSTYLASDLEPGTYTVTAVDTGTLCSVTDSFTVGTVAPLQVTSSVTNDECRSGTGAISVNITGNNGPFSYLWSNDDTGGNIANLKAGSYTVLISDKTYCVYELSFAVGDSCDAIIVHDVITPNGDGINDVWVIDYIDLYPANVVQVFDKWGALVYEKSGYNNDWGGKGKTGDLPDGTYFYLVRLNADNKAGGGSIFKGSLLIRR